MRRKGISEDGLVLTRRQLEIRASAEQPKIVSRQRDIEQRQLPDHRTRFCRLDRHMLADQLELEGLPQPITAALTSGAVFHVLNTDKNLRDFRKCRRVGPVLSNRDDLGDDGWLDFDNAPIMAFAYDVDVVIYRERENQIEEFATTIPFRQYADGASRLKIVRVLYQEWTHYRALPPSTTAEDGQKDADVQDEDFSLTAISEMSCCPKSRELCPTIPSTSCPTAEVLESAPINRVSNGIRGVSCGFRIPIDQPMGPSEGRLYASVAVPVAFCSSSSPRPCLLNNHLGIQCQGRVETKDGFYSVSDSSFQHERTGGGWSIT
jgi:hypothetical protein